MPPQTTANPFYVLLVVAGIIFFVTATAYGVMTVKGLYPDEQIPDVQSQGHALNENGLMVWMDENGFQLLMVELVALAVFTFAAIGTDNYWSKKKTASPRTD